MDNRMDTDEKQIKNSAQTATATPGKQTEKRKAQNDNKCSTCKAIDHYADKCPVRLAKKRKMEAAVVQQRKDRKGPWNSAETPRPQARILVYNVSKKRNVGTICRSAVAMGVSEMMIVGKKKTTSFHGNMNTSRFMLFSYYDTLQEAIDQLKKEEFKIVGVEIGAESKDVTKHPFTGDTCFIFGNEGHGLNEKVIQYLDQMVYIPQYTAGTASLNVACAATIVLHHFAMYAQYPTAAIEEAKFVVDDTKIVKPEWQYLKDQSIRDAVQARVQASAISSSTSSSTSTPTSTIASTHTSTSTSTSTSTFTSTSTSTSPSTASASAPSE